MINVSVLIKNKHIVEISVKGHANSAPYGQDLVCSAVSAIITGGFNALLSPQAYDIKLQDGNAHLKTNGKITEYDQIVLDVIYKQLQTIEESYKKFIEIKTKGSTSI